MAERAKPRITRKQLQCGDLIFFGPKGPKSNVESIYHVGLYLGNGWFIHSTGSTDGVTLSSLDSSSYYKTVLRLGPSRAQALRAARDGRPAARARSRRRPPASPAPAAD